MRNTHIFTCRGCTTLIYIMIPPFRKAVFSFAALFAALRQGFMTIRTVLYCTKYVSCMGDFTLKHTVITKLTAVIAALLFLLSAGCQTSAPQTTTAPTPTSAAPSEISVRTEDCALDAVDLVATLERTHPLFLAEPYPEAYLTAREAFLAGVPNCQTQADFRLAVSLYLNSLNDGHTGVRRQSNAFAPSYAQIRVAALGSDLFILDDDGQLTSETITVVGGVPVANIFTVVDAYFPAENQTAKDASHSKRALNRDLLALAGAEVTSDAVTLTIDDGGQPRQQSVPFGEESLLRVNYYSEETAVSCERMGDVFYIDFNECDTGKHTTPWTGSKDFAVKCTRENRRRAV
jgi:hypothetical protein